MVQSKLQLFSIVSIGISAYFANKENANKHTKLSFKQQSTLSIILSGIVIFLIPV